MTSNGHEVIDLQQALHIFLFSSAEEEGIALELSKCGPQSRIT